MANLDQLTEQILQDAREKAQVILEEAKTQADAKINQALKETQGRRESYLARAKNEAELMAERIASGTTLKIRDEKLSAKGKVIDRVMEQVQTNLKNLPVQDTVRFIENGLKGRTLAANEKLLVQTGLEAAVKKVLGNVSVEERSGLSGYVIDRNGVMENHTFETTLDYMKEDLEAEAAQILFER